MSDKILIVDDEPDIRNLAKMILEQEGYRTDLAADGEEALKKIEHSKPDLVLLDVLMPGRSGLSVCQAIKSSPNQNKTPVIIFTALGRDNDKELTQKAGADSHIVKPFNSDNLLTEIKTNIQKYRYDKFAQQLRMTHKDLVGKKMLLEYDASTPYERSIRDFTLECNALGEKVIIITNQSSRIDKFIKTDNNIEKIYDQSEVIPEKIIKENHGNPLNLVYDNLSDICLSKGFRSSYLFTQEALRLLSKSQITAIFLLNSCAHDVKDLSSLIGLFSDHIKYQNDKIDLIRTS